MTEQAQQFPLYPLFLKLAGRPCLVAGGGMVAQRKVGGLLDAGAAVTVVSPEVTADLHNLAQQGRVAWRKKPFAAADLDGHILAVAATDDSAANTGIAAQCRARGVLVNVADEPELCDFLVPSVVRRGPLAVAVSTAGKSPMLARKLRDELERLLPQAYGEFLEILGRQRETVKKMPDARRREAVLRALVYSDILDLLGEGRKQEAQERIQQCISSQQD